MNDSVPPLKVLVASLLLLGLGACASTDRWSAAGGNREAGVVRVSYEYPEFHQPQMSDAEAEAAKTELQARLHGRLMLNMAFLHSFLDEGATPTVDSAFRGSGTSVLSRRGSEFGFAFWTKPQASFGTIWAGAETGDGARCPSGGAMRNHATYSAGRNTSVSNVATTRPPITA